MCQTSDVVKVESIRGIVWASDVGIRPVSGLLQVVRRRMRACGTVRTASLQCKVKLGGTEFHVVTPFGFGIETKRNHGEEISARRGIREIENVLCRTQTLIGIHGIAGLVLVITDS